MTVFARVLRLTTTAPTNETHEQTHTRANSIHRQQRRWCPSSSRPSGRAPPESPWAARCQTSRTLHENERTGARCGQRQNTTLDNSESCRVSKLRNKKHALAPTCRRTALLNKKYHQQLTRLTTMDEDVPICATLSRQLTISFTFGGSAAAQNNIKPTQKPLRTAGQHTRDTVHTNKTKISHTTYTSNRWARRS